MTNKPDTDNLVLSIHDLLAEVDSWYHLLLIGYYVFQFTTSSRRSTEQHLVLRVFKHLSIHDLLAEVDGADHGTGIG